MAKVVVIDDDDAVRGMLRLVLRDEGHQVRVFEDGAPFLDSNAVSWADLIVTDLSMPTSGERVVRLVRQQGYDIPIIVVSGGISPEKAAYLFDQGVQEVIRKPLDFDEFVLCVEKWV